MVKNRRTDLDMLKRDVAALEKVVPPFPRITYEEAIDVLQKSNNPAKFGDDFGGDEETIISKSFEQPVIIHRYPSAMKAFYMAFDPARPDLALNFDMIAPEGYGEIIGGGERLSSYETLVERLRQNNLPEESFQWYLDLRRYGNVPHAGFGLGLERTVAWICGTEHIREVIPFPRMLYRVYPRFRPPLDRLRSNCMAEKIRIIGVPMDLGASRRGVDARLLCASPGYKRA